MPDPGTVVEFLKRTNLKKVRGQNAVVTVSSELAEPMSQGGAPMSQSALDSSLRIHGYLVAHRLLTEDTPNSPVPEKAGVSRETLLRSMHGYHHGHAQALSGQ